MPFGASAGIIAAGIAAAGTVAGAAISSSGAQDAASTIAGASNQANQLALAQQARTSANLSPFLSGGTNALTSLETGLGLPTAPSFQTIANLPASAQFNALSDDQRTQVIRALEQQAGNNPDIYNQLFTNRAQGAGFADLISSQPVPSGATVAQSPLLRQPTAADFTASPGFNFELQQGIGAIDNSASARGVSGNTLRDLQAFGTGLASQDWWNFYNTFTGNQNRTLSTLLNLSGAGQNAAVQQGGFGQNTTQLIGNNLTGAGSAAAAGQIGSANAAAGGVNNLSNILQQMAFQSQNQPQSSPFDFIPGLSSAASSPSILGGGGTVAAGTPPF